MCFSRLSEFLKCQRRPQGRQQRFRAYGPQLQGISKGPGDVNWAPEMHPTMELGHVMQSSRALEFIEQQFYLWIKQGLALIS